MWSTRNLSVNPKWFMTDNSSKLKKLALLEEKKKLIQGLPHLHGHKFYPWMREYWEATQKVQILSAANQVGKSTTQIRKLVRWATDPSLWPKLWPHKEHPRLFFYFYPSSYLATIEFQTKWVPDILPRGTFKDHPVYGWHEEYRSKYIQLIRFNSGVTIAFKTYSQDVSDLQASSPAVIAIDEECPEDLVSEIQARLFATDGYLLSAFTPTIGAEFWREAIEVRGYKERFPDAFKKQISMYDCMYYEDGTPSHWTNERIEIIKKQCKSEAEIQKRVYGKFVLDSGLKYPGFSSKNLIEPVPIPTDWGVYVGVDSGSGGSRNHPAAISFIAMRPDFRLGYVFKGVRLDGVTTTASDLVQLTNQMISEIKNPVHGIFYDHAAPDLREISARMGASWLPAEKSHMIGEQVLNVGFKNDMLMIFNIEELQPLINELKSLKISTSKLLSIDDAIDSMRYASTRIPWDWSAINETPIKPEEPKSELQLRREFISSGYESDEFQDVEDELEAYNELMENYYE